MNEACQLYNRMVDRGFLPNVGTYGLLIRGLCKAGKVDEAYGFFLDMKQKNCAPNAAVYNAILEGMSRVGWIERAEELVSTMMSDGYAITSRSCSAFLDCLCSHRAFDKAKILVHRMKGTECQVTERSLLRGLCDAGNIESAIEFYLEMEDQGLVLDAYVYSQLINGASKLGNVDKAMEIFSKIRGNGVDVCLSTYRTLLRMLFNADKFSSVLEVFKDMSDHHILSDPETVRVLIPDMCRMDKFGQMLEDRSELMEILITGLFTGVKDSVEKTACFKAYLPLLLELQRFEQLLLAKSVWTMLLEKGLFRWLEYSEVFLSDADHLLPLLEMLSLRMKILKTHVEIDPKSLDVGSDKNHRSVVDASSSCFVELASTVPVSPNYDMKPLSPRISKKLSPKLALKKTSPSKAIKEVLSYARGLSAKARDLNTSFALVAKELNEPISDNFNS
ncbi:hypothetical protein L7F22_004212 [Adiantum nelumboides]|nr:hypothetical protein [Adiantum nelumboides]